MFFFLHVFNNEMWLFSRPPNDDYSPANLQTVNDVIYLNVFDEVVVDILQVTRAFLIMD